VTVDKITVRDYPTGPENGMEFLGGHWVFTGPRGYRVRPNDDGTTFRVVSYNACGERPLPMGFRLTEPDAHALAERLAAA
jgi:hypothetical protein